MANSTDKQILSSGARNAVVRLAGVVDQADLIWPSAILLGDFLFNDPDPRQTLVGLRVDRLDFAVTDPLSIILTWKGGQLLATCSQSDKLSWREGGGLQPDRNRAGYNGDIDVNSVGAVPGSPKSFTVTLYLVKLYSK